MGTGKGREGVGQALAIGLVAGHARQVDTLTAFSAGGEIGRRRRSWR